MTRIAPDASDPPRHWTSIPEAARLIGASHNAIRRLVRQGRLTSRRLPGGRVSVDRAEVVEIARQAVTPRAVPAGK